MTNQPTRAELLDAWENDFPTGTAPRPDRDDEPEREPAPQRAGTRGEVVQQQIALARQRMHDGRDGREVQEAMVELHRASDELIELQATSRADAPTGYGPATTVHTPTHTSTWHPRGDL